jgi:Protein of unknown function (DUF3558)
MRRAGLALLAVLAAACSAPVAGSPGAAPSTEPAPTSAPERPRDVHLAGIDPCSLLTEADRKTLGLDGRPIRDQSRSPFFNGEVTDLCSTSGLEPRAIEVGVELSTTGGLELYTKRALDGTVVPRTVLGFPAAQLTGTGILEGFCDIGIDVAPGEAINVQFDDGGRKPPIPQADLCDGARQTADIVVANLLAGH